ncbi:ABC transporter B family member 6-like [Rutidosis leptorrhynchoides]|uniref:ABC transporter B family member 6-like n=1 Tax=Rutidosis leptorrhynchoides TaxID=125765 RepID=UPI003A9A2856
MFEFGLTPQQVAGPLTPVSENSDVPETPISYFNSTTSRRTFREEYESIEDEEGVITSSAVPITELFKYADVFDWILMAVGSLSGVVHGGSVAVYIHLFGKIIHLLNFRSNADQLFDHFSQYAVYIIIVGLAVFASGWIGLVLESCRRKTNGFN